jgi:hypothetical protein
LRLRDGRQAWQILLATSLDAVELKQLGFRMRFDDVAGEGLADIICARRAAGRS